MGKDSQQTSSSARTLQAVPQWGATETCSQVWRQCPAHHWQPAAGPWVPWGRCPSCYSTLVLVLQGYIYTSCYSHSTWHSQPWPPPSPVLAWGTLPKPTAVRQGNAPTSALTCASVHTNFTKRTPLRPKYQMGRHVQPPRVQTLVCANAGPAGYFHLRYHACTGACISAQVYPTEECWSCYPMALAQWQPPGTVCPHQPAGRRTGCSVAQAGLSSWVTGWAAMGRSGYDVSGGGAAHLPIPQMQDATGKEGPRSLQWGAFLPAPQCHNKSLWAEMLLPLLALPYLPSHIFLACE